MAKHIGVSVALVVLVLFGKETEGSSETMKQITSTFIKVLDECRHEQNFSDHVIRDLYFFWKEDFKLVRRETGCALVCMSQKLNLLDTSGNLHHGNAKEFAMSHGAGDETAMKLVKAIHTCEENNSGVEDACTKALEVAKCFRIAIDELNWVPKMDVVVGEILTEI